MTLVQRIDDDLKTAMKASDAERLSVLRMVKSALKNKQIELGHELNDAEATTVLQKELKQRTEAATEYTKGERAELAAKETAEAELLKTYLPEQLTDDELTALVDQVISETGASTPADMGKVMAALKVSIAGRADGSRVAPLVKSRLG